MKVPVVIQMQPSENAAAVLSMMLACYGRFIPYSEAREKLPPSRRGMKPEILAKEAESYGLTSSVMRLPKEELVNLGKDGHPSFPVVARWNRKDYVIIRRIAHGKVYVTDPAEGERVISLEDFTEKYQGTLITFCPGESFQKGGKQQSIIGLTLSRFQNNQKKFAVPLIIKIVAVFVSIIILQLNTTLMDKVYEGPEPEKFTRLAVILGIMIFADLVLGIFEPLIVYKTGSKMSQSMGVRLFKTMIRLPISFFEECSYGEVLERFENNLTLDFTILNSLLQRMINVAEVIMYTILLFMMNPYLTLACIIMAAIYLAVSLLIQRMIGICSRSVVTNSGAMNSAVLDGLDMIQSIQSSGNENQFFAYWSKSQLLFQKSRERVLFWNSMASFWNGLYEVFHSAAYLFLGAYLISKGHFTLGLFTSFKRAWDIISQDNTDLMTTFHLLENLRSGIERTEDIISRKTEEVVPISEAAPSGMLSGNIKIENVSYRYNKYDRLAVDDVSMEIKQGQIIALVGSCGCGKTTLMKMLAGLYEPLSGRVLYDGKEKKEIADSVYTSSIGMVNQRCTPFKTNLRNNISLWDNTIEDFDVILAARDAKILDRIYRDQKGFMADVDYGGRNFSSGELQRIEFARALCKDPSILLLDEFTSALDAHTEEKVFGSIRERGLTCVIVAHRLSTITSCDYVYVMDNGKIIEQGTPKDLYQAGGKYYELINCS